MAKQKKQTNTQQRLVNDAAKALLANIKFMSVDRPIKSIVITSSIPNEGKTFVSINLAQAIASSGSTCLLVEGDLRKRSLAAAMGIHPKYGLYTALSGKVPFNKVAVATPQRKLYFLDAEPQIPNPPDLLGSRRFTQFVQEVSSHFDYIVFDMPPLGAFVDAAVVAAQADATFLVVRENFTKKDAIVYAHDQLEKAGAEVAGVVMNGCSGRSSSYYDYYNYYSDYEKNEHSEGKTAAQRSFNAQSNPNTSQRAKAPAKPAPAERMVTPVQNDAISAVKPGKSAKPEVPVMAAPAAQTDDADANAGGRRHGA